MHNEFTAIVEPPTEDDPFWIAFCAEMPGANGQGDSEAQALDSLRSAIQLLLEMRREEGTRGLAESARLTTVTTA